MSTRKLMRELQRAGYIVTISNGDHIKITHPTKPGMVFTGASSVNRNAPHKLASQLRRTFGKQE